MGKVVFSGHGSFDPSTVPPFTTVPDGTEIHFYTENLKALLDSYGGDIESMSPAFDGVTPSQSVYAGRSVPNYTLYDPEDLNIQAAPADVDQIVLSGGQRTLHQFFWDDGVTGECHWAACRVVDLDEVGGSLIGANVGQDQFGHEGGEITGDGSGDPWIDAANQWLQDFWYLSEDEQVQAFDDLTSGQKRLMSDYSPDLATWARQRGHIV